MSSSAQRLLLFVGTTLFCVILWRVAVQPGNAMYSKLLQDEKDAQLEFEEYREKSTRVAEIQVESAGMKARIEKIQSTLPEGDSYRWIVVRMQNYTKLFGLDILEIPPPVTRDCTTMPPLANLEVVFTLQGHADRRSFQAFLSAIEVDLSQMRIEKLFLSNQLTRVREATSEDRYFELVFAITAR